MPFAARARLRRDIATAAKSSYPGELALRVFGTGANEDDIGTVRQVRHKRLCQHERAKMVRRKRHVPARRILCGAHRENACVVEQADDRQMECDDFRCRTPNARKVGQITHDRYRVPTSLLDGVLHFIELHAVAPDKDGRAVLGQFQRREAADAGGGAGDDESFAGSVQGRFCHGHSY